MFSEKDTLLPVTQWIHFNVFTKDDVLPPPPPHPPPKKKKGGGNGEKKMRWYFLISLYVISV